MRSRGVLLPDCGDPYVLLLWLQLYESRWKDEIDHLYVSLNTPAEKEIVTTLQAAILRLPNTTVIFRPEMIPHGQAIAEALPQIKEKHIMLVENDGIVFRAGAVDEAFRYLENNEYDIVGSGRGSASLTLCAASKKRFGLEHINHSDAYPHFWPNFLFTDVARLLRTDQDYSAKTWQRGDYIKELDWVAEPDPGADVVTSDTFVWASIQMQTENPRVRYVNQYHADPGDFAQQKDRWNLWDGTCRWLHYGSVSTGFFQMLRDKRNVPLAYRKYPNWQQYVVDLGFIDVAAGFEEYQRRMSWWKMCYDTQKDKLVGIDGLNDDYYHAIESLNELYGFKKNLINDRTTMYRQLLGL